MSKTAVVIYPHQLFESHPGVSRSDKIFLVEEPLFFSQFRFHKQKILLHRASMKSFEQKLQKSGKAVCYLESGELKRTEDIGTYLKKEKISKVLVCELADNWLERGLTSALNKNGIDIEVLDSPGFLTPVNWGLDFFEQQGGKYFMAPFYAAQRKRLGILVQDEKPEGGKWSFDTQNRKRLPKEIELPSHFSPRGSEVLRDAIDYVERRFASNPGSLSAFCYSTTHAQAKRAMELFFEERFENYGAYQDAIDFEDSYLFHSVLSPSLNTGLLTPGQVVTAALDAYAQGGVPLNSVEGFIRQIIGWREYVRIVYEAIGGEQRTKNYFDHERSLPDVFWSGQTNIPPLDDVIDRLLNTAYSNHIERLMVLSNFMLLAEYNPNEVYEWFMSLYIDAYDWVMVPNVYGMSLFADGGMITTKPYVSSSNYIRKMSWYKKGDWCDTWDGMYWSFMNKHRELFEKNQRMRMMMSHLDKMGEGKIKIHQQAARSFHSSITSS